MQGLGRHRRFIVASLAAAAISCSASSEPGTTTGYVKIDDMEGRTGNIEWTNGVGLPGRWSTSTDCTQADRIDPEPYFANPGNWAHYVAVEPHPTMPHVTSSVALYFGTNPDTQALVNVWGANLGFDFVDLPAADGQAAQIPGPGLDGGAPGLNGGAGPGGGACKQGSSRDFDGVAVDLRAYCGLVFWAKAAASGRQALRVQLNDQQTDPRGGQCDAFNPDDESSCYNGFGKALLLTDAFSEYRIDFSDLLQEQSWGYRPSSGALDRSQVFELNFEIELPGCGRDQTANCAGAPVAVPFQVWIDDLYFVSCPG